jgi:hypothetical protein
MKYIDSTKQYGGIILQTWLSNDGFTFIVSEDDEKFHIGIRNAQGYCTGCIYEKFIKKYNDKYDVTFKGAMPPTIRCKKSDLETIMSLLESINKNNLYFDDVR